MKSNTWRFPNTKDITQKIGAWALPILLLAPALRAVEPTPWDTMGGTFTGTITITPKKGQKFKGIGSVLFTTSDVTFAGVSFARQDVKEVVIRRRRNACCEPLVLGIIPLVLFVERIRKHDLSLPMIISVSPFIVGMAAVTGPPLLVVEGVRGLKPAKVLYKVAP